VFFVTREWVCYPCQDRLFAVVFHFCGWHAIQLGFHIDLKMRNIEAHLPFCFIRVGMESAYRMVTPGPRG